MAGSGEPGRVPSHSPGVEARLPPEKRPHYVPKERMAILELNAARVWSLAQTASRVLVASATISSWQHRIDEDGPDTLVQLPQPVNKYPQFVGHLVRRLKTLFPRWASER